MAAESFWGQNAQTPSGFERIDPASEVNNGLEKEKIVKAVEIIKKISKEVEKKDVPAFRVGDTLKVHIRVKEGDKTRTQVFEGVCISRRGTGLSANFAVLKETHGDIVEKIFPIHSPNVEKIVVSRKGKFKRAKLYHLRKK